MTEPEVLSYSQLLERIENDLKLSEGMEGASASGTVKSVLIQEDRLYGLKENSAIPDERFGNKYYDFASTLPSTEQFYKDVSAIYEAVLGRSVSPTGYRFTFSTQEAESPSVFLQLLPSIISILLFVGIMIFIMRMQSGANRGANNFVRGRTKLVDPSKNPIRYPDVAGAEEEKQELKEVVDFLKAPDKYTKLGAKIPKGVLLIGPPGTGKTLLAKAVAGEAGVPFYTISGSEFMEMYVGVGASRVRDLFDQAKKTAPSMIFIDEIDAIGRQRGAGLGGGHDEREQTLNQLLVEMDGFTPNSGVIVLAATNRSDILDPALLRPGRFDRQVVVNYPDVKGREEILKVHSKGKPLDQDVDLHTIAIMTAGATGADLANIMNEAALLTARENKQKIGFSEIEAAINRVTMGLEKKSHLIPPKDKEMTAYHEAGHALVAYYIPECEKVQEITTVPRGMAGGYTKWLPDEKTNYMTSRRLRAHIAMAMGGMCAEQLVYGDVTTGGTSDIKNATSLARSMVTEYGMSDLGPIFLSGEREVFLGRQFAQTSSGLSEKLMSDVDDEVRKLINEGRQRATEILEQHRDKLEGLVKLLLEKEKLDREAFEAFMEDREYDPAKAEAYRFFKQEAAKIDAEAVPAGEKQPAAEEKPAEEAPSSDPAQPGSEAPAGEEKPEE
ncbi:MAG: ATP-dependent zinc metalloprotease FtsH [Clostridia bacterium]|nr:ATP-dependent zinc metalloprotease FtsH [Clostridia bacterium]MBR6009590.1 ATP-dependent zinc metalloprotease FtsH [Clostridia bacterium]